MMSELHVACAADQNHVPHSAAMLHSALVNGGNVVAHYLHGPQVMPGDTDQIAGMFERKGSRIVFHEISDRRISGLPIDPLLGPAMWYRIFLPELLPDVDRILYLDTDTIVVDRLDPLRELDLEDVLLGAVPNVIMPFHRHRPSEPGIEPSVYFNSGVMLLNLDLMRSDGVTDAVYELSTTRKSLLELPDQDALNLVVGSRWLHLHPRWNCMNSFVTERASANEALGARAVLEALHAPAIRHFEGPGRSKPWHLLHDRQGQQLYRSHREATPWPQYALVGDRQDDHISAESDPVLRFATKSAGLRSVRPWHPLAYIVRELPRRLQRLAADLDCPSTGRVLDYGCADIPYRGFFPDGVDYLAADLPGNPDATITINENGTVPVADASVDAVVSTQVLEHVRNPSLYLQECHRVLRPGGRLLLSTHGFMRYHPDPDDYWRWTCAGLRRAVEEPGLQVVRFEGIMGLAASGLQLLQDGVYWRLPRRLAQLLAFAFQTLIAIAERLEPRESRDCNALVFGLIAVKP